MLRRLITLLAASSLVFGATIPASAEVITKTVEYSSGTTELLGYLAYDDSFSGKRPGILVVHEWWGQNEYARSRARMLAKLGYTALAVDMYGEGKTASHPEQAGSFAKETMANLPEAKARFLAAKELLEHQASVDSSKLGAIGYCFGGGVVLQMARIGVDLDGVVSFHGSLQAQTKAKPGVIKAAVFVAHGAEDPFVPEEDILALKNEMKVANADFTFTAYPDAKHSFTNPAADKFGKEFNLPLAYNEAADKGSWEDMQEFFDRVFQ